jgi:hypothetical protein
MSLDVIISRFFWMNEPQRRRGHGGGEGERRGGQRKYFLSIY